MRASPAPFLLVLGLGLVSLPAFPAGAGAQAESEHGLKFYGDLRLGYFSLYRDDRNGSATRADDFRARLRIGAGFRLNDAFTASVRLAGRFSTEQGSATFYIRNHAPTTDGLRLGEATIDEAYLNYRPSSRLNLRLGRIQSKFVLADLTGKSLDRIDSPNTDVTWTDGAHLTLSAARGWTAHLLLQHNAAAGSTNPVRPPISFTDSRSRITYFAALENTTSWGPVVQRSLDITYIPGSLRADGDAMGKPDDYVAFVARGAVAWPVGSGRLLVGGEGGYAPNTPTRAALGLGDTESDHVGGGAYQLAVTLADAIKDHRFGLVYGYTEGGWLIAPDFRNNDRLAEARYYWAFSPGYSFDARLRRRQDLEQLVTVDRRRDDVDVFVRVTLRF